MVKIRCSVRCAVVARVGDEAFYVLSIEHSRLFFCCFAVDVGSWAWCVSLL